MKITTTVIVLSALLVGVPVLAEDMGGMKMDEHSTMGADSTNQSAKAIGIVKAIDSVRGTVTLKHGPIPSIKWPAMTMAFKITQDKAAPLKLGEQVEFEFVTNGMDATITRITAK
ncbi:MAG: copper-binding protein [Nitrospiraceae bacterium]